MAILLICLYCLFRLIADRFLPMKQLLISAVLFIGFMSFILVPMFMDMSKGVIQETTLKEFMIGNLGNNADVASYFVPDGMHLSKVYSPIQDWLRGVYNSYHGNKAEKSTFLGYSLLLSLALLIVLYRRLDKLMIFLIMSAFVFMFLSFGPIIYWFGEQVWNIDSLYRVIYKIPLLSASRTPSRYVLLVVFSLSYLLALLLEGFFKNKKKLTFASVTICVLFLVELYPVPFDFLPFQSEEMNYYTSLNKEYGSFNKNVLNIPADYFGARGEGNQYAYHQTYHEQNIFGGYVSRVSNEAEQFYLNSKLLSAIHHDDYEKVREVSLKGLSDKEIIDELKRLSIYLIILENRKPYALEIHQRLSSIEGIAIKKELSSKTVFSFTPDL